jgi:hypothetical protein
MVVMRENESVVANKVEDVHSIYRAIYPVRSDAFTPALSHGRESKH